MSLKPKKILTLGIDPGNKGCLVFIKKKKIYKYFLMPLIGGKVIDCHVIDNILKQYISRIDHVYMEQVSAMPMQGVTSMFNFGLGYGLIQGLIIANRLPFTLIRPQEWQKTMFKGVPHIKKDLKKDGRKVKLLDNKAMALIAAKRLFPNETFIPEGKRVPHDGLVDSCLIGLYGYKLNFKRGK